MSKRTEREPDLKTKEAPRSSRPDCPDPELFADIKARAAELREELRAYARIRIARLKLAAAEKLLTVVAVAFGVVMALAFVAAAVVFLFAGIAGGLGEATGKPWLGSLITGAAAIALIAVAFLIGRSRLKAKIIPDEAKEKPREQAPVTTDASKTLEEREDAQLARVREAANVLKRAGAAAGDRVSRDYPWTLPAAGFLAGFLAPFLIADREPDLEDDCDGRRN